MAQWQTRDWPGNVRELRNFADRLVLGVAEGVADLAAQDSSGEGSAMPLPQQMDNYERMLITEMLNASNGNVAITADRLGLPKKTLYDKIKKHQLAVGKA
jgi:two-component system C4-dicarboxylate transport response regulator DctD